MKNVASIQTFMILLARQTELINLLEQRQRELQGLVEERKWEAMEQLVPTMTALSESVSRVEEERDSLFQEIALSLGHPGDLAGILSALPPDVRAGISRGYRDLKIAVLRLQSATAVFDSYMRSNLATGRSILRELFPEHTSGGYARDGQGRFSSAPAMMVDQQL